jgi:hypothetical protein
MFLVVIGSADKNNNVDVKVEYEDGEVLPSARAWYLSNELHPTYDEAEPLIYFLDKYTRIIIGGSKAMAEFKKLNKGKTLLDRVTVSDIAYSMLVYESSYDVWMEEMVKEEMCATREEKKAFKSVATNKYHVQRGARLAVYADGWTSEGRDHFNALCDEIQDMMNSEELWSTLQRHWDTYSKKYHQYSYVRDTVCLIQENAVETLDQENDDDCVVFLPGDEDDLIDGEHWDDGVAMQGREKQARKTPV